MAYINGNKSVSVVKTQSVAVDVEANPTGTATETLEKLKVGDTIYSADGGASSPDTSMSDSSVNAVQNKVIKKYVDDKADTKANTDGYYSTMGVGHSDSALSLDSNVGNDDQTPFNYQTAGGDSDITTGIQSLKKLVGASVVFNQLVQNGNFESTSGWSSGNGTLNVANNIATITSNTTNSNNSLYPTATRTYPTGHKYLEIASVKIVSATNQPTRLLGMDDGVYAIQFGEQNNPVIGTTYNWAMIKEIPSSATRFLFQITKANASDEVVWQVSNVQVFDLTQMFGSQVADYLYNLANGGGITLFRGWYDKPYYPYNTGTFIHSKSAKLKMVDYNQWDEQWENGNISTTTGEVTTGNKLISKNFIPCFPNTQYYKYGTTAYGWCLFFYYDSNMNFISNDSQWTNDGTFTTPNNAYFMKFITYNNISTYNHDICISLYWDGSRIGYEPYQEHIYDLPNDELKGILKVVDNKIVADGDEEYPDGTKKTRYILIDLGTLTYNYVSGYGSFNSGTIANVIKHEASGSVIANCLCPIYTTVTASQAYTNQIDMGIGVNEQGNVFISNSNYSSGTDLKNAMSGVYALFELATPTETTSTAFAENIYADDFGTMEFLDENNARISGIQGNEIFYKANISGFAESLYVKTDGDVDDIVTEEDISDTALATRGYIKLASITGYDATKTQVLKNVNGTFTWVDEV